MHRFFKSTWTRIALGILGGGFLVSYLILPQFHIHQDIDMLTVCGGNGNEQSDDAASSVHGGVQDGGG
jgi:hypothetical protein